jgi:predicted DNA-binding transcriptional regulator YafY
MGGRELAERLEVDVRTVRRYVTMLQDLGIPIEAERGRYGAYRLGTGYKIPPLMLSDDEALAVVLGLLAAQRLGLAVAALSVEGALAKIERVLPGALRTQVQAVERALTLDLPAFDSPPVGDAVLLFGTAAQQHQRVWLRYRARGSDEETERLVDPYGIVYREGRWYAVGHCHLRDDLRVFRLDRVLEARPLDVTFSPPTGFDTLGHLLNAMARMPSAWEVEVLLPTSLPEARAQVPPALGTLETSPDGVVLRCSVEDLDWMAQFLAGLPWPFAIRRPDELRAALRRRASALLAAADRAAPGAEVPEQ